MIRLADVGIGVNLGVDVMVGRTPAPARAMLDAFGFDSAIARKGVPAPVQAGVRWTVEHTHAWMNAFGKLRRPRQKRTEAAGDRHLGPLSPEQNRRACC